MAAKPLPIPPDDSSNENTTEENLNEETSSFGNERANPEGNGPIKVGPGST